MRLLAFVTISLLGISAAQADFCAWNPQMIAQAALTNLPAGATVRYFCKGCGDKAATSEIVQKTSIEKVGDPGDNYYEVHVNGHAVDLAYVFVTGKDGGWGDLGFLTKCSDDSDLMKALPGTIEVK